LREQRRSGSFQTGIKSTGHGRAGMQNETYGLHSGGVGGGGGANQKSQSCAKVEKTFNKKIMQSKIPMNTQTMNEKAELTEPSFQKVFLSRNEENRGWRERQSW